LDQSRPIIPCTSKYPVTVVISTRDRGDAVLQPLQSLFEGAYPNFATIVVDQSKDDSTQQAISSRNYSRLTYIRTPTKGLSTSRNIGLKQAATEFVAFTDDDCQTPTDWLQCMVCTLAQDHRAALAFCNVVPGDHDANSGFIPDFIKPGTRTLTSVRDIRHYCGIGAGMIVRRSLVLQLGGFDEMLGSGAPLGASEDRDLSLRVLLRGLHVIETDGTYVTHNGFRTFGDGVALARRNWLGIGTVCGKAVRIHRPLALTVPTRELGFAILDCARTSLASRRLRNVTPVVWFAKGFYYGLRTPLDEKTMCFLSKATEAI
jgi:glycosyltransferase involved in cell wall biosynthesis